MWLTASQAAFQSSVGSVGELVRPDASGVAGVPNFEFAFGELRPPPSPVLPKGYGTVWLLLLAFEQKLPENAPA